VQKEKWDAIGKNFPWMVFVSEGSRSAKSVSGYIRESKERQQSHSSHDEFLLESSAGKLRVTRIVRTRESRFSLTSYSDWQPRPGESS
jgi:hypothetical protein